MVGLEIMLLEGRYSIACPSRVWIVLLIWTCWPPRRAPGPQRHLDGECGVIKVCVWPCPHVYILRSGHRCGIARPLGRRNCNNVHSTCTCSTSSPCSACAGGAKASSPFISECYYNIALNLSLRVWLAGSINAGLCLQAGKAIQDADAPRLMQAIFI